MLKMKRILLTVFCCLAAMGVSAQEIMSPDGHIRFSVTCADTLSYTVSYDGKTLITPSVLGFELKDEALLGRGMTVAKRKTFTEEHERWTPVVKNRHAVVDITWNRMLLTFAEPGDARRQMQLEVKAFDEGVAFRYHLYGNATLTDRAITRELTEFSIPEGSQAYVANHEHFVSSQEKEFVKMPASAMTQDMLAGLPLLVEVSPDAWLAITEANIDDYPGFHIRHVGGRLTTCLAPWPGEAEDSGVKARFGDDCWTPWRVVLIGKSAGRFMESEIIRTLNPPCQLTDTSWIRPGLCAWDHWWSGEVKMETPVIKEYINLAAKEHWPYMLIDWQWYGPFNKPEADITTPASQLDWQTILSYAKQKGVQLWLWLYSSDANRNDAYKKAFPLYHKWGIAGVKIDFMDREDQYMVNWYRRIVAEAAKNHLMIDLHGAYKPDGIERTYPNFLTREGVMGNEYNKWGDGLTAEHNVKLAYTRVVAGPMDYTPGGFLNVARKDYKAQTPTLVPNTRAAELSKFIIYESPFTVVCDHPKHILGQVGADFLSALPSEWDDTRFLQGTPDTFVALARRHGDIWYVGVMNDSEKRTVMLDMRWLGDGTYAVESWTDGNTPADAVHKTTNLKAGRQLKVKLSSNGGAVFRITRR